MIKLFIGSKGSGKTKTLIDLTNAAAEASKGSVVCMEKGDKLKHEITYKARLIDTNSYAVDNAEYLYGFVAGVLASNSDITDIFIDSALKICNNDCAAFEGFLKRLEAISNGVNIVITASIAVEECPDAIKAYA